MLFVMAPIVVVVLVVEFLVGPRDTLTGPCEVGTPSPTPRGRADPTALLY